jgi:hypothetical protein
VTVALQQPGGAPADPFAALEWPGDVRELAAGAATAWWLAAIAAVVLVGALAWRRAAVRAPSPAAVPAAPTALQRLRALALPPPEADPTAFYVELKALLRQHCRERFAVVAEVATSEELLRAVPQLAPARGWLAAVDRVLFAAERPATAAIAAAHAQLAAWVVATARPEAA